AEHLDRFGIDRQEIGSRHTDQLALDSCRVADRPREVEDSTAANPLSNRPEPGKCGMMLLREQECDAEISEALFCPRRRTIEIETQRFERIGAARERRGGAVAMLGDG